LTGSEAWAKLLAPSKQDKRIRARGKKKKEKSLSSLVFAIES
jgi:hypothetical protein